MTSALRSGVLGAVDGVVTSFAIVAASDAGRLGNRAVIIVGFASLFGDATSMAVSETLAVRTDAALRGDAARLYPVLAGASCFAAFVACGLVPLLSYLATASLVSCAAFSVTTLMLLGATRARLASTPLLTGLLETASLGAAAGGIAYGVGLLAHAVA
jgi:VIT1/CCC1 family predicted Fe2+/Mn2+ transporter